MTRMDSFKVGRKVRCHTFSAPVVEIVSDAADERGRAQFLQRTLGWTNRPLCSLGGGAANVRHPAIKTKVKSGGPECPPYIIKIYGRRESGGTRLFAR
jgi:hypothetical protein